jgi:toxin HigB-1
MIKSFRHKGLQVFFNTGSKAGIQPHHASKLNRQLLRLDIAKSPSDMNLPGWHLHALEQELIGHYSIWVNGNWRITFRSEGEDVILVDYQDYH